MKLSITDFSRTYTSVNGNLTLFSGPIDLSKYRNAFITQSLIDVADHDTVDRDMREVFELAKEKWPGLTGIVVRNGYQLIAPAKQISRLWAF